MSDIRLRHWLVALAVAVCAHAAAVVLLAPGEPKLLPFGEGGGGLEIGLSAGTPADDGVEANGPAGEAPPHARPGETAEAAGDAEPAELEDTVESASEELAENAVVQDEPVPAARAVPEPAPQVTETVPERFLAELPRRKPPAPKKPTRRRAKRAEAPKQKATSPPANRDVGSATRAQSARTKPAAAPGRSAGGGQDTLAAAAPSGGGGGSQGGPRFRPGAPGNPLPAYPERARRRGYEGTVTLNVRVSAAGAVLSVSVGKSSGHGILDRAAEQAVRRWRFRPDSGYAAPATSLVVVPIAFRLTN